MGYKYYELLTKVNYTKMTNKKNEYIVIHYTGNRTDSAVNNARYFQDVNRGASANYFVDETSVYCVVKPTDRAWHVGVNYGSNNLFGKCSNSNSIGIEMCSKDGKIEDCTYKNTVELTKKLMKEYNIPITNVVRHYDVCTKVCPGWAGWVNGNDYIWLQFLKDCADVTDNSTTTVTANTFTGKFPKLPLRGYFQMKDKGTNVKKLQKFLNWYGNYGLDVDGILGSMTFKAVMDFQKCEKLTVDGYFGKDCLKKSKICSKK